ncbi:MAG: tetratricopeptide repeat protein [Pseudobdellovibrionaceae bacterium]
MKILTHALTLFLGLALGWVLFHSSPDENNTKSVFLSEESKTGSQKDLAAIESQGKRPTRSTLSHFQTPKELETPEKKATRSSLTEDFWSAFHNDDFDKARALIEQVSKSSKEYHEWKTRILVRTREYQEAKVALKECLKVYPKSRSCLTDLSAVEGSAGTRDEQLAATQNCLAQYPDYPMCLNDLAIIRMHEGKFAEAVTIYEQLLRTNGSFGFRFNLDMLYSQLGFALEGAGRIQEALQSFDKACRENFPGACLKFEELNKKM